MDKNKQFSGRKEALVKQTPEFQARPTAKRSNSVAFFASLRLCMKQKSTHFNHRFIGNDMVQLNGKRHE